MGQAEDSALQILDSTVTRHATVLAHNDVFWMLALLFVLSSWPGAAQASPCGIQVYAALYPLADAQQSLRSASR